MESSTQSEDNRSSENNSSFLSSGEKDFITPDYVRSMKQASERLRSEDLYLNLVQTNKKQNIQT